jgi:hypothetical protein
MFAALKRETPHDLKSLVHGRGYTEKNQGQKRSRGMTGWRGRGAGVGNKATRRLAIE